MDSCKIIFVLIFILCDTKVSHQNLWPHAQEESREEKVCQSFDMCATLNGICNYGKCETHKCTSEIHCVCNEGYTGHRCDIGAKDVNTEDSNESKTSKLPHEASSFGQLKDLSFTTTIQSHVETLTTPVPESQIKQNSSFQKITTESSRKELSEASNVTMSSETQADNANINLVNNDTNIPSNKRFSEFYHDHEKGDHMKIIATQQLLQNGSFVGLTLEHTQSANNGTGYSNYSKNTTAKNGSGYSNYSEHTTAHYGSRHSKYSENAKSNNDSWHSNYSENTTANNGSGHSNYSENTTANNGSGHSNYSENTTANNGSGHSNYSENLTAKVRAGSERFNYSENTTAKNGSWNSNYSKNTTANTGSGHFNYSEDTTAKPLKKVTQVQATYSLLTDIYNNESTHLESTTNQVTSRDSESVDNRVINYTTIQNYIVGPTPEHTPSANNGSWTYNYSEHTTAHNGSGHSNYSENTTAHAGSEYLNLSENTTANNGSGHSNYSEDRTDNIGNVYSNHSDTTIANNVNVHSNYSGSTTANNGIGHFNYSESTTAAPLNKVIQVQITYNLLNDIYDNENTHLESTTNQPTSRDSEGVDNRITNYTTIKNYLDKRHHIGTTESTLTERNTETSTVVKTTTDQLSITDSSRIDSYTTKTMTIASLDTVDKNKTIQEKSSSDRTQSFGKSEGHDNHAAQLEVIVRNSMDTDQKSLYQSTPKDIEFGPYVETIGSMKPESIFVTNREKMHFRYTQKVSETIGIAEHAFTGDSNQNLQSEQDIFAADNDKPFELYERNGMTNMHYEKMESSEEEQDILLGSRSVEMHEDVSVQKPSFKMEDMMVKKSEMSKERPSEKTQTTVRTGYYKRGMKNRFAHTSITSGHSMTETTTPATLNDNVLDYVNRTTIRIFETNAITTESTKPALNGLISDDKMNAISEQNSANYLFSKREQKANISFPDLLQSIFFSSTNSSVVETIAFTTNSINNRASEGTEGYISEPVQSLNLNPSSDRTNTIDTTGVLTENTNSPSIHKNDILQQAQERNIHDHHIVFSTTLDNPIINGLESMSNINGTNIGSEQMTDAVTETLQDLKSSPVLSDRFLTKSDLDNKSVDMMLENQRSQLLQYTKMNEIHISYENPYVERKETSTILDTTKDPMPQRQIVELNTISSTERAEVFKEKSYKDKIVGSELIDMPLPSSASLLNTTKPSLPSVLNTISFDKSSLLNALRRLLLLEDTFFIPSQMPYSTTHSNTESQATTYKASSTYRTIGDQPGKTTTTNPITSVSVESDFHTRLPAEQGLKHVTQLKESHLRHQGTDRTSETTTTRHEIENHLSKPAYHNATPNSIEMKDDFTTSSVPVDHQINAKTEIRESGLNHGSHYVVTNDSFTGQQTESTIGLEELNETGPSTVSMKENSEKYVTSFDNASNHSAVIDSFITATTLAALVSKLNEGQKKRNMNMLDNSNQAPDVSSAINSLSFPKLSTHLVTSTNHITKHLEGIATISIPTGEQYLENESYNLDQVLSPHSNITVKESEKTINGQTSTPRSSDNRVKLVSTEGFPKGNDSEELMRERSTSKSIEHLNRNETDNNTAGLNNNDTNIMSNYSDSFSIVTGEFFDRVIEQKISSIKTSNAHIVSETETSRLTDIFSTLESPRLAKGKKFTMSHSKIPQFPLINSSKHISGEIFASNGEMDNSTVQNKIETTAINDESQSPETQNDTLFDNARPHLRVIGKSKNDIK